MSDSNESNAEGRPSGYPRPRTDSVDVRGPDERSACIQLAARWAEIYKPAAEGEHRDAVLKRFRAVHDFLDAVVHDVEPPELEL
jgi:hypothetical protein